MPRFRPANVSPTPHGPLCLDAARAVIADALRPEHFFAAPALQIETIHRTAEEVFWEIFQGRLLDPPFTTRRQSFETWHLVETSAEGRPALISVWLDEIGKCIHVTRSLYCHAWEGYHAGDNVYLSRESRKWMRERVGTIRMPRFSDVEQFRDETICLLLHAVVGLSRLPLTSVESPLPAFSLGELFYVYRPNLGDGSAGPMRSFTDLINQGLTTDSGWLEKAKLLETLLHATPMERLSDAADALFARWREIGHTDGEILALLRTLFNEAALSPYTDLVDKTLAFLDVLETNQRIPAEAATDFLAYLLRQLGRHLTAYDLVVFHHRGANYPDALFLDAVLKAYLQRAERRPDLFREGPGVSDAGRRVARLRRRALRQAWLLRSRYEGHPVPDAPTSEGENNRILPAPHVRVPEEQIVQVHRRKQRLFANDPLEAQVGPTAQEVFRLSLMDLQHPDELRELGMALFLDRPLGIGKAATEPDQTLLFSYEAFSRSVAEQRLGFLAANLRLLDEQTLERLRSGLRDLAVRGIPLSSLRSPERPAPVSLRDARRVADDFLVLRNTRKSIGDLVTHYDWSEVRERFGLDFLADGKRLLLLQGFGATEEEREALTLFDADLQPRLLLTVDARQGYESRGGCEYPVAGLMVVRVWDASGTEIVPSGALRLGVPVRAIG